MLQEGRVAGFASITLEGFSGNVVIKKITRSPVESKQVNWDVETSSESTTSGGLNDYADGKSEPHHYLTGTVADPVRRDAVNTRVFTRDVKPTDQSLSLGFNSIKSLENENTNNKKQFSLKKDKQVPPIREDGTTQEE